MTTTTGSPDTTAGSDASTPATGGAAGEEVTLTVLVGDDGAAVATAEGLAEAYTALHPNVTFDIETRPGGSEGDNLVKTRLATGEMSDVFYYNAGSLLQALNPEETIVDIAGDPMLDDVADAFVETVSQNGKVFGVPAGTGMGGGILYNRTVFEEQGIDVPLTWEEFAANNDKLLEAGVTPLGASFGDTWTSQLFVLADYYNVAQAVPNFAEDYTANKVKYATTPAALAGFEHLEEAQSRAGGTTTTGRRRSRTPRRCCSTARSRSIRCSRSPWVEWRRSTPRQRGTSASSPSRDLTRRRTG